MQAGLPVVSFAGDRTIFNRLESGIVSSLPTAAVEWKRSYGRTSKSVYVEVQFQNFDVDSLLKGKKNLIGQHVMHTYWTDCSDVDVYKNTLKEEILSWLGTLKKTGSSSDWLLILVESSSSRANKLLARTTVLDRIKQDIGGKSPERCISIMDPTKSDSKAAESMQTFLHKFRQFFLQSYNRTLNRYEELIRSEREKRNEPGWNFCNYFLLQEQLAFAYEIMGLHEEALVQYDELDALFTQFILNSSVGVSPAWLSQLHSQLEDWTGFSLDKNINSRLRINIEKSSLSLLDLRNYLFSRQGGLLVQMTREEEVAKRCLNFLHNTLQELNILEVECTEGSKEIWVCLCAFEVLNNTKGNNLHSAALWSFLREKVLVLGALCGLTPAHKPSSSQLHLVVSLFGGLKDDRYLKLEGGKQNPVERLKESLSSQSSFEKHYLYIAETAISNYKHIGRIRSARLIGIELAQFYLEANQIQQAIAFLADSLKTFQFEGWQKLSLKTLLDLAKCYNMLNESEKYLRTCVQIASCSGASDSDREFYFNEICGKLDSAPDNQIITSADDTLQLISATQVKERADDKIVPGVSVKFLLEINSNLPVDIECDMVELSHVHSLPETDKKVAPSVEENRRGSRKIVQRSPSVASSNASVFSMMEEEDDGDDTSRDPGTLHIIERLEYKQDKSLYAARIVCKNATKVLKRKDSSGTILKDGQLKPADYTNCLSAKKVTLFPGKNKVEVVGTAGKQGIYTLNQLRVTWRQLALLENLSLPGHSFTVAREQPLILLNKGEGELVAGKSNKMSLSIYCGSENTPEGLKIQVTCGRGLQVRAADQTEYATTAAISFPAGEPFQTISVDVWVLCHLDNKKDSSTVEHSIKILDPWREKTMDIALNFIPALYSTFNLLTAMSKKFLQLKVFSMCQESYKLSNISLELINKEKLPQLHLESLNDKFSELVISKQFEGAFLWQLNMEDSGEAAEEAAASSDNPTAYIKLSLTYAPVDGSEPERTFTSTFQFQDYRTLYTVIAKVEPAKGNEFCRASTLCPMKIEVNQLYPDPHASLFYEILADQTQWAVCGKQGAVINVRQSHKENIIVDVMPLTGGHLPLPTVRLSKYIPAEGRGGALAGARLDPFSIGQVYNMSRAQQIHVLPPVNQGHEFLSLP